MITIDAMGCQKKIAKKIADKEGNYLLAVEGNQPNLFKAFDNHFSLEKFSRYSGISFTTEDKGHGRTETRMHLVCDIFEEFVDLSLEWPVMKSLGIAISHRVEGTEEPTVSVRYYISSASLSMEQFADAVRAHWGIENSLHWVLDCEMREDDCRIHRGDAAENLAGIRHITLNLLKGKECS